MTKTHLKVKTLGESVLPADSDRIKGWQGECVLYDLHISSCSTLCYWSTAVDLWITDTLRHMKVELRLPIRIGYQSSFIVLMSTLNKVAMSQ